MSQRCGFCNALVEDEAARMWNWNCPRCGAPLPGGARSTETKTDQKAGGSESCPECGSSLTFREGCMACTNPGCGWSACG